ncbi:hypothetical protein [Bacillus sp. SJS]|uniref:hypothetical protein n=1 Tax=Bacillus sp. SJS TaxID=1423321 RepID=UPI0012E8F633|nr:hypothetical protein [Bacillus sp. SJS]
MVRVFLCGEYREWKKKFGWKRGRNGWNRVDIGRKEKVTGRKKMAADWKEIETYIPL